MTDTARYPDNLTECDLCGAPIPAGLLCQDCREVAEEWAGFAAEDDAADRRMERDRDEEPDRDGIDASIRQRHAREGRY